MWTCPDCGRTFQRNRQSHYCGSAPTDVPAYIEAQPPVCRPHLYTIRAAIQNAVPDVRERIAWHMPTYEKDGRSISFSACKNHVSLYVGAEALEAFSAQLQAFETRKSAVYFPYDREIPVPLVENLVQWCLQEHRDHSPTTDT